jgi:DNA replication initiation complex subunit (GINS family)
VLEQMNFDLFGPLHEWLIAEGFKHGKYPKPPQAVGKATIRVNYVSILAQAINAITSDSISKFTQYVGEILQMAPAMQQSPAGDKFDPDAAIEAQGKAMNVPAHLVRSDSEVAKIRSQRQQQQDQAAQQQAQEQQANVANTHADTAQTLSQTPTDGGQSNALDQLRQAVGGGAVAGK